MVGKLFMCGMFVGIVVGFFMFGFVKVVGEL